MRIRRSARPLTPAIPTASMADIAFLLIIFFMVTTAYSIDRTPMDLPETREQQQVPKGAAILAITRDGGFRFSAGEADSQPVADLDALAQAIRGVTAANSLHPFVIKADRLVPYGTIDQVLEQLRLAGAQNVSLLSRGEGQP
jgi:biopolymer transport protein ExbD